MQQPVVGQGLQTIEASLTHTSYGRTPLDKGSARLRDLYLTTHNTQQTDIHAPGEIRTHNHSRRAAADLRLRPRGQWDQHPYSIRQFIMYIHFYYKNSS
jgi:hypothetical protein